MAVPQKEHKDYVLELTMITLNKEGEDQDVGT